MDASGPPMFPPAVRSYRDLRATGVSARRAGTKTPADLPLQFNGATYAMAQAAEWLDREHVAVGRWDGTLSVFRWTTSATSGPLITVAVSDPAAEGVQAIQRISDTCFSTSAGSGHLALWARGERGWADVRVSLVAYDRALGAANSMALVRRRPFPLLAVGHASGLLSLWVVDPRERRLRSAGTADVRHPEPVNPWGLQNIRGVSVTHGSSHLVAGSESGAISIVEIDGLVVSSQTLFSAEARRGVNSIALRGRSLLVATCAVRDDEPNLWYFELDDHLAPRRMASSSLRVDVRSQQVFNFSTVWIGRARQGQFVSSTEEGALWMGRAWSGRISLVGYREVTSPLGSALAWDGNGRLVLAGHDLYEFEVAAARPVRRRSPSR